MHFNRFFPSGCVKCQPSSIVWFFENLWNLDGGRQFGTAKQGQLAGNELGKIWLPGTVFRWASPAPRLSPLVPPPQPLRRAKRHSNRSCSAITTNYRNPFAICIHVEQSRTYSRRLCNSNHTENSRYCPITIARFCLSGHLWMRL